MKKKLITTILCAMMVCMIVPVMAYADQIINAGEFNLGSTLVDEVITIADGATVTLTGAAKENVTVVCGENSKVTLKNVVLNCTANNKRSMTYNRVGTDFTITLVGTNDITCRYFPGIGVLSGRATFDGTGSLTVFGGGGGAAIGGEVGSGMGEIVINSGDITARGGQNGPGIGGGMGGNLNKNITINGGTVSARGGSAAAGIGGGLNTTISGTITINDGTVTAQGGFAGAGIGGGFERRNGRIEIAGGKVYATGGDYAAGIGGGQRADFFSGGIDLDGGEIYASAGGGGTAQDIGHGDERTGSGSGLLLSSGSLIFLENESAGIYSLRTPTPDYTTFNSNSDVPSRYSVPASWTYPIGSYGTIVADPTPAPVEHTPEKVSNPQTGDFASGSNNTPIILLVGAIVVVLAVIRKRVVRA